MAQGSYIAESVQDLINRSRRILGEGGDQYNIYSWYGEGNIPNIMNNIDIISSSPADTISTVATGVDPCYNITIKNSISSISSSIVTCAGPSIGTCMAPGACPLTDPTTYINMVTTFTAAAAQSSGATITFQYILNGIPTTTILTPGVGGVPAIVVGTNTYYAFPTNIQYPASTTLSLYGVDISTST